MTCRVRYGNELATFFRKSVGFAEIMILSVNIDDFFVDKFVSEKTPKSSLRLMDRTAGPQTIKW